ncbi:hypothetical protein [Streptomyces muensis]|uniref:hypothetical protein n=1 Tax=Streptomyces muensis TaxID=1077944 RepID=UPI0023589CA7|nr:hypothetical protein [Streptomyces muensis]
MSTPRETTRDEALGQLIAAAQRQLEADWLLLTTAQQTVLRALSSARRRGARPGAVPPAVRTALAAFTAATARFNTDVGALVERWTAVDLPRAYRLGAEDALRSALLTPDARRAAFEWSPTHQDVLSVLTAACYPVLIRRITDIVRRAQAFARAATAAARALDPPTTDDLATQHPLDTVPYGRGTQHPAASWARAALSAQSVTVANTGALTATTADLEARWVQVTDGPECGWTSHPEPDRAHDTLRSAEEAAIYPIAHPGCLRRFIPRPDLNHDPAIEEGQPV